MADMLATPENLASLLQRVLDADQATMLIECATAVVQEAAGQRIVQVVDDPGELLVVPGRWVELPERPVSALSNVALDGVALTEGTSSSSGFIRFGHRLFRACGWSHCGMPAKLTYVYTHGLALGHQRLQFARKTTLGLARLPIDNPSGATQERIDDYSVAYDQMAAAMEASPSLQRSLQRAYGQRAGTVRLS